MSKVKSITGTTWNEVPSKVSTKIVLKADICAENLLAYNNYVTGRVLTIVDASVTNPQQAKAMKDLIKTAFWSAFDNVKTWMQDQTEEKGGSFPFGGEYMASVE